jgi:RHS repeat-associated protein
MRSFYEKFSFCCDHAVFTPNAGNFCKNIFFDKTRIVTKVRAADETSSADAHREYFYHGDHLQSATLITDYEGAVYERINYTPYGELWLEKSDNNGENYLPYRFTGKELDSETGLYYYGARYLDPMYSRWISTDPALGEYIPKAPINDEAKKHNQNLPGMGGVFNTVNLNLYHYAGNNPIKYTDPDRKKVFNKSN